MRFWKHVFGISLFFVCSACADILDKEPIGILDTGSFFKTAQDAEQAVNAAYNSLLFNNENNNFYWGLGVIASDEAVAGGDGSRPGLSEFDFLIHTPPYPGAQRLVEAQLQRHHPVQYGTGQGARHRNGCRFKKPHFSRGAVFTGLLLFHSDPSFWGRSADHQTTSTC